MSRWVDLDHLYELSDCGEIRNKETGLFLSLTKNGCGYLRFRWFDKTPSIHRLVAKYFVSNPDNLNVVNHIDGVKTNNHYSNLEWTTHSGNNKHAYDTGLNPGTKGETHGMSVIDDDKVKLIFELKDSFSHKEIANVIGCSKATVGRVLRKEAWTHVSLDF